MEIWDELRDDLRRLQEAQPRVLHEYPNPRGDRTGGPYSVTLAAFAEDVAAELHAKYGGSVHLRVGAMPYPLELAPGPGSALGRDPLSRPQSSMLDTQLAEPLVVRSGHAVSHELLVTNHAGARAVLHLTD